MTYQLFSDTRCIYACTHVYYGRARNALDCKVHQCNAINTDVTLITQRVNRDVLPRENQNYPCFNLSSSHMFLARPIPVVSQPVLPIAPKFQIISLSHGAPAAPTLCIGYSQLINVVPANFAQRALLSKVLLNQQI